jgi:2-oxoglutarate dehydrogenase E2 component (dihydrolipoamide succinyltransferase)
MPQLGISVTEGTIVKWRTGVGDKVAYEQPICDISTDKIESELPAPVAGTVAEILVEVGKTVDTGTAIARIDPLQAGRRREPDAPATDGEPPSSARRPPVRRRSAASGQPPYSPAVLRLAAEHDVDLSSLSGTGQDGRVRKQDVLAAIGGERATDEPVAYRAPQPTPLSIMRRTIGEHMKRSLDTAATVTSWIEVDFNAVERARAELGVTALPVVAQATIQTLAEYPDLNAWLDGERYIRHTAVNLAIAVALEGGLIAPVIRDAQLLDVAELALRIRDLAGRARSGELAPDDVQHATFTITNPGQFGTIMATPVISEPQVAILDIEAIVRRPIVVADDNGTERIAIRPVCILGLSWDHRALDGALAARFLATLRARLERWGQSA